MTNHCTQKNAKREDKTAVRLLLLTHDKKSKTKLNDAPRRRNHDAERRATNHQFGTWHVQAV